MMTILWILLAIGLIATFPQIFFLILGIMFLIFVFGVVSGFTANLSIGGIVVFIIALGLIIGLLSLLLSAVASIFK